MGPDPIGLVALKEEEEIPGCTCIKKRPCEDTARR